MNLTPRQKAMREMFEKCQSVLTGVLNIADGNDTRSIIIGNLLQWIAAWKSVNIISRDEAEKLREMLYRPRTTEGSSS